MLFFLSRIIFIVIILILTILLIKKKIYKKLVLIVCIILCLIIVSLSAIYPVENIFISFKSQEDVFKYANSGKIEAIANGEKSSMIIYSNGNNSYSHYIVPKTENGYKIPNFFSEKKIAHKFGGYGSFDVYSLSGTNDFFVDGLLTLDSSNQKIVDSNKRLINYIVLHENPDTNTKSVLIYSNLKDITDDYYLIINDQKIRLFS